VEQRRGSWLAVGLGNPGLRYQRSRHNAGRRAIERLAATLGSKLRSSRVPAEVAETKTDGIRLLLARPATYMNDSGRALAALVHYYRIHPEELIVVHDDVDLPVGVLRVKRGGGSAGHHGIDSITEALGTKDFFRIRVGVGRPVTDELVPPDFLLHPMSRREATYLGEAESRAAEAVLALVHEGLERTMNRFNTAPKV
jgi:peptidyl-tRNA hydrolase, PTH1 family